MTDDGRAADSVTTAVGRTCYTQSRAVPASAVYAYVQLATCTTIMSSQSWKCLAFSYGPHSLSRSIHSLAHLIPSASIFWFHRHTINDLNCTQRA